MGLSSRRILQDEDDTPMFIEDRWVDVGYNENEILLEDDDDGETTAILCPVCGQLFLDDPNFDGRCPFCGFNFTTRKD